MSIMNAKAIVLCSKCHRSVGFSVETGLCFWHENMRLQAELAEVSEDRDGWRAIAERLSNAPCMQEPRTTSAPPKEGP